MTSPSEATVAMQKFGNPCRICENVNKFNKIREIIQERSIFSHWGQLRDSNTTIKKGSNIFSTALRKQQKILACFSEDKLIYLDLQIQKVFTPMASNALCFLLEHQWMFEPFLIVVFESLNCPQCEKMDLKIIQSLLERVQICKICWKTEESAGHGGLFWRTVLSLTVQNKQGTREQPSQNKKQS